MTAEGPAYKYRAFISYRNVPSDRKWAKWLAQRLETYRAPTEAGLADDRIGKIFRDDDEGPASSNLRGLLTLALEESEFLIVICSRETRGSRWVPQEIRHFQSLGRAQRILALLVDGEPKDSFPPELLRAAYPDADNPDLPEIEPLAADVRPRRDEQPSVTRNRGFLRIAAALLRCEFDHLERRDAQRQRRRARLQYGIVAASVLAVLSLYAGVLFDQTRKLNLERATFLAQIVKSESDAVESAMDDDRGEYARAVRYGMIATLPGVLHPPSDEARDELAHALQAMPEVIQYNDPDDTIIAMTMSPAKTRAVLVGLDGFITTVDLTRNRIIGRFKIDAPKVYRIVHHPLKNRVALECGDRIVRIVDLDEQREVFHTERTPAAIFGLAFNDDGRYVMASGSPFSTVWDSNTGAVVDSVKVSDLSIETAWLPFRHVLSIRLSTGELILRDPVTQQSLISFGGPNNRIEHFTVDRAGNRMFAYRAVGDTARRIATEYGLGYIDLKEMEAYPIRPFERSRIKKLELADGSNTLIITRDANFEGEAQTVEIASAVDVAAGTRALAPLGSNVLNVTMTADSNRVITAHVKGAARLWDIRENPPAPIAKLQGHGGTAILDAQYVPAANQIITRGGDGNVVGWSLASYERTAATFAADVSPKHLMFSPDGKRLLVASEDEAVILALEAQGDGRWRSTRIAALSAGGRGRIVEAYLTRDASGATVYMADGSVKRFTAGTATILADLDTIQRVAHAPVRDVTLVAASTGLYVKDQDPIDTLRKIAEPLGELSTLSVSSDARFAAVGDVGAKLVVIDVATGAIRYSADSPRAKTEDAVVAATFSPDGRRLAYSRQWSGLSILNLDTLTETKLPIALGDARIPEPLADALRTVRNIAFTASGDELLLTVQTSGLGIPADAIASYDLRTGVLKQAMQFSATLESLQILDSADRLLATPLVGDTAAMIVSLTERRVIARKTGRLSSAVAYDPVDRKIAISGYDTVTIWDARNANERDVLALRADACARLPAAQLSITESDADDTPLVRRYVGRNVCELGSDAERIGRGTNVRYTGTPENLLATLEIASPRVTTADALREYLAYFPLDTLAKIEGKSADTAKLLLAAAHGSGLATPKDAAKARALYEAIATRVPAAKHNLGALLLAEDPNSAAARKLITEAADAGFWRSNRALGQLLLADGDAAGANSRFEKALDAGDAYSATLLAEAAAAAAADDASPAACAWAREGLKRGDPRSMIRVVNCLDNDQTQSSFDRESRIKSVLHELAAQDGDPEARAYAAQRLTQ